MKLFLTGKHWQIFILLFAVPFLLECVMIGSIIINRSPAAFLYFFPSLMILFSVLYFSWFYTLGTNLYRKLPPTVSMSLTRFRIFLLVPAVYLTLFSVFMATMMSGFLINQQPPNPLIFLVIFPLHFFSLFCMLYCLYFVAKAFKAAEWQRPVAFSDFVGEFFLLWFFPVGVWILQPRLNKLFAATTDSESDLFLQSHS